MKAKKQIKKVVKKAVKKTAKKITKKPVKKAIKKQVKKLVSKVAKKIKVQKKAAKKIIKKVKKDVKKNVTKKNIVKQKKAAVKTIKKAVKKISKQIKKEIKTKVVPVIKAAKAETAVLTQKEIKEIEQHLLEMRKEILERIKNKKNEELTEGEIGDEADMAAQSLEKEVLFELNDSSHEKLDQIEAALRRISKGIYGTCEYCRKPIPKKRILALPFARYCINCQVSNESIRNKNK